MGEPLVEKVQGVSDLCKLIREAKVSVWCLLGSALSGAVLQEFGVAEKAGKFGNRTYARTIRSRVSGKL